MSTQQHTKNRTVFKKWEENSEPKNIANKSPGNGHSDIRKNGQNSVIRTRYGRVIKKTEQTNILIDTQYSKTKASPQWSTWLTHILADQQYNIYTKTHSAL